MRTEGTLTADVTRPGDDVVVIDVAGDVTPAVEDELMTAWSQTRDARAVVLGFDRLEYMNSGGIGLLVTLLVEAQRADQRLLAFGLNDHYRQIFSLTRLDDVIELAPDRASALAAAGVDGSGPSGPA